MAGRGRGDRGDRARARFWALALSVYAVDTTPPPATKPLAKVI